MAGWVLSQMTAPSYLFATWHTQKSITSDGRHSRKNTASIYQVWRMGCGWLLRIAGRWRSGMASVVDMTGKVIGPWTVIGKAERPAGSREQGQFWLCECQCLRRTRQTLPGARLRAGRAQRGCIHCRKPYGPYMGTSTYESYRGMVERCTNPRHASWHRYGGRGIRVCDRWLESFNNFRADMGERPKGMSLDRINCNGNYEPDNCRWADSLTQARNKDPNANPDRAFKLTDEQVAAIIRLSLSGARQIDIAEACGVSRGHIAGIAAGLARTVRHGRHSPAEIPEGAKSVERR